MEYSETNKSKYMSKINGFVDLKEVQFVKLHPEKFCSNILWYPAKTFLGIVLREAGFYYHDSDGKLKPYIKEMAGPDLICRDNKYYWAARIQIDVKSRKHFGSSITLYFDTDALAEEWIRVTVDNLHNDILWDKFTSL